MKPTESFILTHLNEIVSILVAGIMGWMGKTLWATIQEQKALKKGVKAMLHDRLYQSCRYYLHQGYVDVEGLTNVGVIYECLGKISEAKYYYQKCGSYEPAKKRLKLVNG